MTTFFIILFISLLASGMQLTWGDTEVDMKKETEEERKNE